MCCGKNPCDGSGDGGRVLQFRAGMQSGPALEDLLPEEADDPSWDTPFRPQAYDPHDPVDGYEHECSPGECGRGYKNNVTNLRP